MNSCSSKCHTKDYVCYSEFFNSFKCIHNYFSLNSLGEIRTLTPLGYYILSVACLPFHHEAKYLNATDGTRTHTPLQARNFKFLLSTSSSTVTKDKIIGVARFELTATYSQGRYSTRLSYTPICDYVVLPIPPVRNPPTVLSSLSVVR